MLRGWLKKIEEGRFETELIPLTLSGYYGKHLEGQGLFTWTKDSISINAVTDGASELMKEFGKSPVKPGQLFPPEYYLKLESSTRDGWKVLIERISPEEYHIVSNNPSVVWKVDQNNVCSPIQLFQDDSDSPRNYTEVLLTPNIMDSWPRSSKTIYDNQHFGHEGGALDWLEYNSTVGKVAAQNRTNDLIRLRIKHGDELSLDGLNSITMAFSYLCGRLTHVVARETKEVNRTLRIIHVIRQNRKYSKFAPPLGVTSEALTFYEKFLSAITNLFNTDKGQHIANYLYACLDSVDNTFTTHILVLCSTVEYLVKDNAKGREATFISKDYVNKILELMREESMDESGIKRLKSLLGSTGQVSVKDILHEWRKRGALGISEDDITAWSNLRNRVMHGKLLLEDSSDHIWQDELTAADRVKNLINKIILNEAKYESKFFDYSKWKYEDFEPVDLR